MVSQKAHWVKAERSSRQLSNRYINYIRLTDTLRWVIWVVLWPEAAKGFVLLKKRWKVEYTFGWWNRYRRLCDMRCYRKLVRHLSPWCDSHYDAPLGLVGISWELANIL